MITKEFLRNMQPGEVLTVVFQDAAALDSAYRVALNLRGEEETKPIYGVSRGATTMTLTVRRWPGAGEGAGAQLSRTIFQS